ncbi:hypothetical protein M5E87_04635 [Flavonifractor plautii]|nr:hypothetical protein M5E87_04635 [Flavonifractor plautii]
MVKRRALLALLPCFSWLAANNRRSFPHPLVYLWKIPPPMRWPPPSLGAGRPALRGGAGPCTYPCGTAPPLRQTREAEARWQLSTEEANLVDRLNRLYERYTLKYLGAAGPGAMPLPPSARWPTMPWSRTAASG